jgi:deoxyadenosine/deoxycytidine kinase
MAFDDDVHNKNRRPVGSIEYRISVRKRPFKQDIYETYLQKLHRVLYTTHLELSITYGVILTGTRSIS